MADFNLDNYLPEDRRSGVNVREAFCNRFELWLLKKDEHYLSDLSKRVFVITGPFGIGKTWFLRYIEASATRETCLAQNLPRGYTAKYIDWREVVKKSPRAFVTQVKREIQSFSLPTLCLCVDNIPGRHNTGEYHESLGEFEEVLHAALKQGAFLVMAQEDPQYRSLRNLIPAIGTEPYKLGDFTREGVAELLGPNHDDDKQNFIYDQSLGHPYLAWLLIEHDHDVAKACTILVDEWLKDRSLWEEREQIFQMAYPLSLISLNVESWKQMMESIWRVATNGSIPEVWERNWKQKLGEELQWLMYREHEGKISSRPEWYKPIQKCLQERFKKENPTLYNQLRKRLTEGGAAWYL